ITPIGKEGVFNADSIARFQSGDAKLSVISIEPLEVTTDIASYIKAEKAAGAKVLVIPHWGTEYEAIHNSSQAKLAHSWINAGADIVIGGHPHVVEDAELYNGKPIFYSLGNLLFDQTFSKETQRGLIVAGEFNGDKLTLTLLPTKSVNMKPSLLTGAEKTDLISSLRKNLGLPTTDTGYGFDKIEI
ncbi:MAG: CapA family protein, partial [Candidatus Berkelbacteria bacterium]|nr:CapA family protein [Candidatus Berkelbacteria bacterium]